MIRRLQRKFVLIVIGFSAAILLAVFIVLLVSTYRGMASKSRETLKAELALSIRKANDTRPEGKEESPEGKKPPLSEQQEPVKAGEKWNDRLPCFIAVISQDGSVSLEKNHIAFLNQELTLQEIEELARQAASSPESFGMIPAYHLRYLKRENGQETLVAFADTSAERSTMAELIKNSLIVGFSALLVLLGISIRLSRWAVKPVETAWMQQKQFVADASHELKTPLTVILSNADMILDHSAENGRHWTENIKAEALRMKRLTEELLSLARSEDTVHKPRMEQVDFSYLVTDSILLFEPSAFECRESLTYQVEEGIFVQGEPAALSQLAEILLDNAVKYSSEGGSVSVTLKSTGKNARLSVSSTGEPIASEDLSRIFERFYRGDPSRNGESHGLGLAIAKNIAASHRGKIWAESKNGWNTFTVLLPCLRNPAAGNV